MTGRNGTDLVGRLGPNFARTNVAVVEVNVAKGQLVKPTISCGVAGFSWATDRVEDVLNMAAEALQQAKDGGGHRVSVVLRSAS